MRAIELARQAVVAAEDTEQRDRRTDDTSFEVAPNGMGVSPQDGVRLVGALRRSVRALTPRTGGFVGRAWHSEWPAWLSTLATGTFDRVALLTARSSKHGPSGKS